MSTQGDDVTLVAGRATGSPDWAQRCQRFIDRLDELADELARFGLTTRVVTPVGRIPSLRVVNPIVPRMAEDVYVGSGRDGIWCFWWPWADRIAAADDLAGAATRIAKVLGARDLTRPFAAPPIDTCAEDLSFGGKVRLAASNFTFR